MKLVDDEGPSLKTWLGFAYRLSATMLMMMTGSCAVVNRFEGDPTAEAPFCGRLCSCMSMQRWGRCDGFYLERFLSAGLRNEWPGKAHEGYFPLEEIVSVGTFPADWGSTQK